MIDHNRLSTGISLQQILQGTLLQLLHVVPQDDMLTANHRSPVQVLITGTGHALHLIFLTPRTDYQISTIQQGDGYISR